MNSDAMVLIIAVVVLVVVWWSSYERLSRVTRASEPNSGYLLNPDDYYKRIKLGRKEAMNNGVLICGLIRDSNDRIKEIRSFCDRIGSLFKQYKVIMVENDSKDNTRMSLLEWSSEKAGKNGDLIILGCGINASTCTLNYPFDKTHSNDGKRFTKMANLRNIYLDFAEKYYSDKCYKYMIVWDPDIQGQLSMDGILNSMGVMTDKSMPHKASFVCSYGIKLSSALTSYYYDTIAHEMSDTSGESNWPSKRVRDIFIRGSLGTYSRGSHPIPVRSCFGGFTIYNRTLLGKHRYDTPVEECEHLSLNRSLNGGYMNPSMKYSIRSN